MCVLPTIVSALFSKLGMAHKNVRDICPAVLSYKQAIAAGESDFSESVSFLAGSLAGSHINLGNLFHSVGDHAAAVPHYKKGIELTEQCCDMVSHAWAHGNLGNTFLSLSKHKEAFDHLQMSLDLTLQHEPTPTAIGRAYNNLGIYYQAVGDLDKAKECYDTALGQGVYGQDQAGQARANHNIGNVYMLEKNPERAVLHYSEVLRLTCDILTAAVAHHNRGCAYFELGQKNKFLEQRPNHYLVCGEVASQIESEHRLPCTFPDDVKHYHRALKDLNKVIVGHEETFASIKGSSSGLNLSVAWFETNAKTFLRGQDCAYSIGDHNRALVYAEQCRARTLGELLNNKTSCSGSALSTPIQSDSILSIIKHLKTPNVPVVVLSYTGTRLLVWVLVWDGEEVKMTSFEQRPDETMFDGKTFDHYIRYSLSEMLTGGLQLYGGLEDQTISDESPAAKLFDLIGKPLLRILEMMGCSGSRMVLVPDSYTKLLPFSALYDTKRQCFLGDSHSIVYSPSLLTLGVMCQMPPIAVQVPLDSKDMCVVGNPTTPPFMYNKEEWDLGPLPYATEEARSVAHMLQTTPLLHQQATKNAVLAKIGQAKVIHLATHGSAGGGFFVLGSSSHNFATVTRHTVEDPSALLLHASELESMDISAALAVLSSCDSGRGVIRGDDIQGMARSFLLAGARAVLTSLWEACLNSRTHIVQYLLSTGRVDPLAKNKYGATPVDCASVNENCYDLLKLFQSFPQYKNFPVHTYTKLILTGHSGAGKTTTSQLILLLANETTGFFSWLSSGRVTDVKSLTAGITTLHVESKVKEVGNMVIYDFAGQQEYYSSHAAVLERIMRNSAAIFVCIVDLSQCMEKISESIHYWMSFMENACNSAQGSSHVIIVGSHADLVRSSQELKEKSTLVESIAERRAKQLTYKGFLSIDCRESKTKEARHFRSLLSTSQQAILSSQPSMSLYCHVLYAFFRTKLGKATCTLQELTTALASEKDFDFNSIVLTESLISLSDKGLILFLQNQEHPQSSWVVVEKDALLREVNGTLFAPDNFKQYRQVASNTGIVPIATLEELFPKYSSEMLVGCLESMEFCHPVDLSTLQATNLKAASSSPPSGANHLFFPSLVKEHRPGDLFSPKFGWCLGCSDPHQYFSNRFLHVLLLRLAFTFPLASKHISPSSSLCGLERQCDVWQNGICWKGVSGVSTIVEIVDRNRWVIVLVSEKTREAAQTCSIVIRMILDLQHQFCSPLVTTCECLISPSLLDRYPLNALPDIDLFDLPTVARSMLLRHKLLLDRKEGKNEFLTDKALSCEPYYLLQPSSVCQLFNQSMASQPVPDPLLQEVLRYCQQPQQMPRDHKELRECVNKHSIFSGRNPLVSCSVQTVYCSM